MGDFTDLVWVRIFSQTSQELKIFSPTYNGVRFFFLDIIRLGQYFFQCRILFFPGIYLHAFFLSKSIWRIFFLNHP